MQDQTTLNLLASDGAVAVTFAARLTADQYARLYQCIGDAETVEMLRDRLAMVANEWGMAAIIDDA
jgi:hypothetical protein